VHRAHDDWQIDQVRAQLDPETFEKAHAEGRALAMEKAIEYALKDDIEL
jgi:hypothetical protein